MPFAFVPFLLLVIPIVEIAAFIVIGGEIGIAWTLLMILVTAIVGSFLLRTQGISLLNQVKSEMDAGRVPGKALGEGAMILVAGILLLTPGFVTDTIGFLLFAPPVRSAIWAFFASRITVVGPGGMQFGGQNPFSQGDNPSNPRPPEGDGPIIDLDADDYESGPKNPNSPWNDDSIKNRD